ncbi:hypothetical protein VHA_002332 [Grimontia hollisae CIP 101886]|uniref:Uncharacterized protein n=1 Tax=Grimontia hollisae CIP 101886 TaxID=675812 RepID=D0I8Z5_GRIHO|nr:hypothetical protein VHA_002332 [Grimontia hollisae CIP 101886]
MVAVREAIGAVPANYNASFTFASHLNNLLAQEADSLFAYARKINRKAQ